MHSFAKASELFILESEPQIPRHARSGREYREYRLRPRPRRAGAHSGMVTTYEQGETINREREAGEAGGLQTCPVGSRLR